MSIESGYPRKYWWIVVIVVPIMIAIIGILPMLLTSENQKKTDDRSWIITGRVRDFQTEFVIQEAHVTLEVKGIQHLTTTDSEGVYRFTLQHIQEDKIVGFITVEARHYQRYRRSVELSHTTLIMQDITLLPLKQPEKQETPVPTPVPLFLTPTGISTPTPISTAIPLPPTPTPTMIPTLTLPPTPTPIPVPQYDIGVMILDQENVIDWTLSRSLAEFFNTSEMTTATPWTEQFVKSGEFQQAFNGNLIDQSALQFCRYAVLGKKAISFTTNSALENVITANVTLTLNVASVATGIIEHSVSLSQTGAGFSQQQAEQSAIERIFTEIPKTLNIRQQP